MKLSERCKDMVKGNTQYTIAEWQETLLKAADELDRLERLVGLYKDLSNTMNVPHMEDSAIEDVIAYKELRDKIKAMEANHE